MARRRKKAPKARTRRASYRVRSTKKGQRRYGSRRAYMKSAAPARRRVRRNPKGPLSSPAVQYSLAAAAGFAAASYADTAPFLNPTKEDGTAMLPFGIKGSVLAGVLTLVAAQYALRGKNKQYARAAAIGMFAPSAIGMVQNAIAENTSGGARHLPAARRVARLAAPRGAARGFANASRSLDNVAA